MHKIVCLLFFYIQRPVQFTCHLKYIYLAMITSSVLTLSSDTLHLYLLLSKKLQH